MNNLDKQYQTLLQTILDFGVDKKDRTGTGTRSIFGYTIRHNMKEGFPLLTTKKMPFRLIVTELIWFLRGDTNIKYLVDNDCHIWDGDAYKNYLKEHLPENGTLTMKEFIELIKQNEKPEYHELGDLGPIYGKQWRNWKHNTGDTWTGMKHNQSIKTQIDQITNLINDLKTNPDSRRLMVNAWNVGELDSMVLPPCHYGFQVYTRELSGEERWDLLKKNVGKELFDSWVSEIVPFGGGLSEYLQSYNIPTRAISLMWNQRSVDTFLGLPFNIASYGLLLEIIAKAVNMVPDELIGNLGDTHLYLNHVEQAKEQIGRELSLDERKEIYEKEYTDGIKVQNDEWLESKLKTRNISTLTREPYLLPKLFINDEFWNHDYQTIDGWINSMEIGDFQLEGYQSHPHIKAPLSN
jgi:thymidylate synthase